MRKEQAPPELDNKVATFWHKKAEVKPKNFYNTYDYADFWKGREFEDEADRIAIRQLINKMPFPRRNLIDVGGGIGRIASLYETIWGHAIILDPSSTQLAVATKNVSRPDKIDFVEGSAESIPLPPASCDAALCIRTFHYIENPQRVIREIARVLMPGGYFILEIANKIHMKARIKGFFSKTKHLSHESISRAVQDKETLFLNHHPVAIRSILSTERFEIIDTLSVSNFRSPFLKNILSVDILLFLERILQEPLAKIWFGPSIYFLARKSTKNSEASKSS